MESIKYYAYKRFNRFVSDKGIVTSENTNRMLFTDLDDVSTKFCETALELCKAFRHNTMEGIYQLAYLLKEHAIVDASDNHLNNGLVLKKYPPIKRMTDRGNNIVIASSDRKLSRAANHPAVFYNKLFPDGNIVYQAFQIFALLSLNSRLTPEIVNIMIILSSVGANYPCITQRAVIGRQVYTIEKESMEQFELELNDIGFSSGLRVACIPHLQYDSSLIHSADVRATTISIYYKCAVLNGFVLTDGHHQNIYLELNSNKDGLVSQIIDVNPEMLNFERDYLAAGYSNERRRMARGEIITMRLPNVLHQYRLVTVRDLYGFAKNISDKFLYSRGKFGQSLELKPEFDYCYNLLIINNPDVQDYLHQEFRGASPLNILLLMGLCSSVLSQVYELSEYLSELEFYEKKFATPKNLYEKSSSRNKYNLEITKDGCLGVFYLNSKTNQIRCLKMNDLNEYYNYCVKAFDGTSYADITEYEELSRQCTETPQDVIDILQRATSDFGRYLDQAEQDSIDKVCVGPIETQLQEQIFTFSQPGSFGLRLAPIRGRTGIGLLNIFEGTQAASLKPKGLKVGMQINSVGGKYIGDLPYDQVLALLRESARPVKIGFINTSASRF